MILEAMNSCCGIGELRGLLSFNYEKPPVLGTFASYELVKKELSRVIGVNPKIGYDSIVAACPLPPAEGYETVYKVLKEFGFKTVSEPRTLHGHRSYRIALMVWENPEGAKKE